mmetsp:Transcript_24669/g.93272  ORF Transcript_24669/g.93272 Transcript_24669/m.93272 type:complete len:277 (-) Transcript_24669:69-899(-)
MPRFTSHGSAASLAMRPLSCSRPPKLPLPRSTVRSALEPMRITSTTYTRAEMPMDSSVPLGMAVRGLLRSPLMFAPAMMPVAAGKKIARQVAKVTVPSTASSLAAASGNSAAWPSKAGCQLRVPRATAAASAPGRSGSRKTPAMKDAKARRRRRRSASWNLITTLMPTNTRTVSTARQMKAMMRRSQARSMIGTPTWSTTVSARPSRYSAMATALAAAKSTPMAPPSSGPREREMRKYAPPPCTRPLVEMAESESVVSVVMAEDSSTTPITTPMPP